MVYGQDVVRYLTSSVPSSKYYSVAYTTRGYEPTQFPCSTAATLRLLGPRRVITFPCIPLQPFQRRTQSSSFGGGLWSFWYFFLGSISAILFYRSGTFLHSTNRTISFFVSSAPGSLAAACITTKACIMKTNRNIVDHILETVLGFPSSQVAVLKKKSINQWSKLKTEELIQKFIDDGTIEESDGVQWKY